MDNVEELESIDVRAYEYFLYLGKPLVHLAVVFPDVAVLLVCPVCGYALLGNVVHPPGAYLDLDPESPYAHESAVEGFVTVALGMLDPVPDPVGLVPVNACDYGEYVVALVSFRLRGGSVGRENDSDRIEVIDLFERDVLGLHLVPDGIWRLYPFLDAEIEAGI